MSPRIFQLSVLLVGILVVRSASDISSRYRFAINMTDSLPNWAFITDRDNHSPKKGELAAFYPPHNPYYPDGSIFMKRVLGVPGDRVEARGRDFYINGQFVGHAKEVSQTGRVAVMGPVGVLPPETYFLGSPHKDGYDSRYRDIGWIPAYRLVGVGTPVL